MINFPTRGGNTLDQIYSNVKDYYKPSIRNLPFGLSDHITITAFPELRKRSKLQRKTIKIRSKRRSNIAGLGRFLIEISSHGTVCLLMLNPATIS